MKILVFILLLLVGSAGWASPALVDNAWLVKHKDDPNLVIVDLRPKDFFEYAHIPGSVHSDYGLWREKNSRGIGKMLPAKARIESLLSDLGATPESHIVLIHSGQTAGELASATRVYWTLEQINHQRKSIHAEGIFAYAAARLPLARGPETPVKSQYRIARLKGKPVTADVVRNNPDWNRIDVRSQAEYLGIYQVDGENPGTIPGAVSLPFDWLTVNGTGQLLSRKNLQALQQSLGLKAGKTNLFFCHTGHRASLSWFVAAEILGDKQAVLFDGSTAEWSSRSDLPTERKIQINF